MLVRPNSFNGMKMKKACIESLGNIYPSLLFKISDKINEHDEELESIDILFDKGILVTSSRDGLVKIWNIKKELLREIKFNEPIFSACFLNSDADLVIGHSGQISVIYAKDY